MRSFYSPPTLNGKKYYLAFLLFFTCSFASLITYAQVAAPSVTGSFSICSGSSTTLTATGQQGATFGWYTQASGGTVLSSSAVFTTASLNATTKFYVQQTSNGNTSVRTNLLVQVAAVPSSAYPTNQTASPASICQGQASNLSAAVDAAAGQFVYWYDASTDGNLLGSSCLVLKKPYRFLT